MQLAFCVKNNKGELVLDTIRAEKDAARLALLVPRGLSSADFEVGKYDVVQVEVKETKKGIES